MLRRFVLPVLALAISTPCVAQQAPPLIGTDTASALSSEISGSAAKRTVQALSLHHRMRGSRPYARRCRVDHRQADGRGPERRGDDRASGGRQDLLRDAAIAARVGCQLRGIMGATPCRRPLGRRRTCTSWADHPISLAEDSVSGTADAPLVDVGAGTSDADYAGKDVRGKLVLVSAQPSEVAALAVTKYRRRRNHLLGAEPEAGVVGRGPEPGPLGPPRYVE